MLPLELCSQTQLVFITNLKKKLSFIIKLQNISHWEKSVCFFSPKFYCMLSYMQHDLQLLQEFFFWSPFIPYKRYLIVKKEKTQIRLLQLFIICQADHWFQDVEHQVAFLIFFYQGQQFLLSFYTRGKERNGISLCLCLLYLIIYIIQLYDYDISKCIQMHTNCNLVTQ